MENVTILSNVRDYYVSRFSHDSLASKIYANITFLDVLNALRTGMDIYESIGVTDSVIRENIFHILSKVCILDIETIYNMWLKEN